MKTYIRTVKGEELVTIRRTFQQNESADVETNVKLVRFTPDGHHVLIERSDDTALLLTTSKPN